MESTEKGEAVIGHLMENSLRHHRSFWYMTLKIILVVFSVISNFRM